jgi:hypothetical protein
MFTMIVILVMFCQQRFQRFPQENRVILLVIETYESQEAAGWDLVLASSQLQARNDQTEYITKPMNFRRKGSGAGYFSAGTGSKNAAGTTVEASPRAAVSPVVLSFRSAAATSVVRFPTTTLVSGCLERTRSHEISATRSQANGISGVSKKGSSTKQK